MLILYVYVYVYVYAVIGGVDDVYDVGGWGWQIKHTCIHTYRQMYTGVCMCTCMYARMYACVKCMNEDRMGWGESGYGIFIGGGAGGGQISLGCVRLSVCILYVLATRRSFGLCRYFGWMVKVGVVSVLFGEWLLLLW